MRAENDAAITAATTAWPQGHTYRIGEVPSNPPTPYQVVSVDSGQSVNYRRASLATTRRHRLSVQFVGDTYNEAAFALEKAEQAFLDKRLNVAGKDCSPLRGETATDIQRDPDGGVLMYGLRTYTFTTTPTE